MHRLETLNKFADAKNAGSKFHVVQLENGNNTVGWLPGQTGIWQKLEVLKLSFSSLHLHISNYSLPINS